MTRRFSPKRLKKSKILGFSLLLLLILTLLLGFDFSNYKHGNRSHFFGSLDNYSQNQTLHLYNLDVWVTKVDVKAYPKPAPPDLTNCSADQSFTSGHYISIFDTNTCSSLLTTYNIKDDQYKNYKNLRVDFWYKNISQHPINMNNYHFQLTANANISAGYCEIQEGTLLDGSSLYSCSWADVAKNYGGPLSLIVKSGKIQKQIKLNINP